MPVHKITSEYLAQLESANQALHALVLEQFFAKTELPDLTKLPDDLRIALDSCDMAIYTYKHLVDKLHHKDLAAQDPHAHKQQITKGLAHLRTYAQNALTALDNIEHGAARFKTQSWYQAQALVLVHKLHIGAADLLAYCDAGATRHRP